MKISHLIKNAHLFSTIYCLCSLPNNQFGSGSFDGNIKIWKVDSFKCSIKYNIEGSKHCIQNIGFHTYTKKFISASTNNMKVWELKENGAKLIKEWRGSYRRIESISGQEIIDDKLNIYNLKINELVREGENLQNIWALTNLGGMRICLGNLFGWVTLLQLRTGETIKFRAAESKCIRSIIKIGERILLLASQGGALFRLNLKTYQYSLILLLTHPFIDFIRLLYL